MDALVKVPDKLSEVFGDVLELACGGGGGSGGGGDKNNSNSAGSRIGMVTGVAIIRDRWVQRGTRSPLSSVTTTDSADSTTSSSEVDIFQLTFFLIVSITINRFTLKCNITLLLNIQAKNIHM